MKLKRDKYKSARGKYSRLLELSCRVCDTTVAMYQKDGPGGLLRLYMDRIHAPEKLVGFQHKSLKDIPHLRCPNCEEMIGTPYIYKKEKRKAFRLYHDALKKKIRPIKKK